MGLPVDALAEWPTRSLDLALAEVALEADTGRYGESLSEATAPGADASDYTTGYRYVPKGPFTNQAEKVAREAEEQWRKTAGKDVSMAGMFWTVEKETYTPVVDGEVLEVQLEQAAYGATADS